MKEKQPMASLQLMPVSGDDQKLNLKGKSVESWLKKSLKVHRFVGVSLGGGKANKTCMAVVEYYPNQNKIFLSEMYEKIQGRSNESADSVLLKMIEQNSNKLEFVAFDAPLLLPKCVRCKLSCPGFEICKVSEIKWMRKVYQRRNSKLRPKRSFTPYTERCSEVYIANELEESFHPPHALGANMAPLAARAMFLNRRLKSKTIEVNPKVSLWRVGRTLSIQKSFLRSHKHSIQGVKVREHILKKLISKDLAFLYTQDVKTMVSNGQAFDAFICALTAVLKFKGQVEKRPKGYPKGEAWVEIPVTEVLWD